MEKLDIFRKTAAESYAAGQRDSRHFMSLYRAYLRAPRTPPESAKTPSAKTVSG